MATREVWTSSKKDHSADLSVSDRRRYLEKTKDIGNPYLFADSAFSDDSLPPMLSTDIFNYLVLTTSFCTPGRFKAYKSLDAYKYFTSGFVNSVAGRLLGDNFVVVGKVCTHVVYVARVFVKFSLHVLTVG